MVETDLYERALKLKGETSQIDIAVEELAELMQALIKYKRNEGLYEKILLKENIVEELADVQIMIKQLIYNFDVNKEFIEMKNKKLERLKQRLDILEEEK